MEREGGKKLGQKGGERRKQLEASSPLSAVPCCSGFSKEGEAGRVEDIPGKSMLFAAIRLWLQTLVEILAAITEMNPG